MHAAQTALDTEVALPIFWWAALNLWPDPFLIDFRASSDLSLLVHWHFCLVVHG